MLPRICWKIIESRYRRDQYPVKAIYSELQSFAPDLAQQLLEIAKVPEAPEIAVSPTIMEMLPDEGGVARDTGRFAQGYR